MAEPSNVVSIAPDLEERALRIKHRDLPPPPGMTRRVHAYEYRCDCCGVRCGSDNLLDDDTMCVLCCAPALRLVT